MLKFGANHMIRGRNFTQVFDLGTMAPELAELRGGRAFSVLLLAGEETSQAVMDPRVMRSVQSPVHQPDWAKPFHAAAFPRDWTVIDLRRVRPGLGRSAELSEDQLEVLHGFDAVVVLTGSRPQKDLVIR